MSYDASAIQVLEGLDAVRKRPGMYIGSTGERGLHHLVYEVVDNAVDEALAGYATEISVTIMPDGAIRVVDDGRGIPVDEHPIEKKPAVEVVLTVLHAGGKFGGSGYSVSGGLHGVGVSVVNALSTDLAVEIHREGNVYRQHYKYGAPAAPLEKGEATNRTGTTLTFWADGEIFETTTYDFTTLSRRFQEMAFLNRGLKLSLTDERTRTAVVVSPENPVEDSTEVVEEVRHVSYMYEGGITDFVRHINASKGIANPTIIDLTAENDDKTLSAEISMQWNHSYAESVYTFANTINTTEGGTHEEGFRTALTSLVNKFSREWNILKEKDTNLSGEDIREGLTAIVSVKLVEPQFEGQTKTKLGNTEMKSKVQVLVNQEFPKWLSKNTKEGRAIVERCALAAKARMSAKKARELTKRKSILETAGLPGKLADCSSKDPSESELFIVEGDSAAGPAKQARESRTQAILPIRGKIINVQKVTENRALQNEEISSLIKAIGTGIKAEYKGDESRYDKIIFLTDADVDGAHIRTLLLTFFFKFMPGLIKEGKVWIAEPPLYRAKSTGGVNYLKDDDALDKFKKDNKSKKFDISRFKGLGEMNAGELWDTAMNPESRTLIKVNIADGKAAEAKAADMFEILMGSDVSRRKTFIEQNAKDVRFLDV